MGSRLCRLRILAVGSSGSSCVDDLPSLRLILHEHRRPHHFLLASSRTDFFSAKDVDQRPLMQSIITNLVANGSLQLESNMEDAHSLAHEASLVVFDQGLPAYKISLRSRGVPSSISWELCDSSIEND
ncbi:hypothetical protein Fmac_005035 [Flemingia macrophylla]|uniref:Uncharacterized protein n=1 Tax=Flemingia macrophylla TaxID=520843 RepID=A0ABD1N6P9_9FABA